MTLVSESMRGPNPLPPDQLAALKHGELLYVLLATRDPDTGKPLGWTVHWITPTLLRYAMRARTDERGYTRLMAGAHLVARFGTEAQALDWLYYKAGGRYVRVRPKPRRQRKVQEAQP